MGRLLGLDVGARRTGVAVTDALQIACSPHATVETSSLLQEVLPMHQREPFDAVVIGKPMLIVGGATDSTLVIDEVAEKLRKALPSLPIHFVDEGNTSLEASQIQLKGGMKKSQRRAKGSLDAIAASLILQRHLDAQAYK